MTDEDRIKQIIGDLACPGCPSEVRLAEGAGALRARVIHTGSCPWWRRFQVDRVPRCVPCGTVVTHRGPYKRDPERVA